MDKQTAVNKNVSKTAGFIAKALRYIFIEQWNKSEADTAQNAAASETPFPLVAIQWQPYIIINYTLYNYGY